MSSTSEKGHAKNVGNFQVLITHCTSYTDLYQPSQDKLKLTAMQTLYTAANAAIRQVAQLKIADDTAIVARQDAFEPIRKLATRIVNNLSSSGAADGIVEHVRGYNRKLQGTRISKKKATETPAEGDAPATHSDSQQSFDNLIQHFANIVDAVTAEPKYLPNEPALKPVALDLVLTNLRNVNTEAITTNVALTRARANRDTILYKPKTGLVDVALDSKDYILSVFGRNSSEYKIVGKLEFIKPKEVRFAADMPAAADAS